MSTNVIFSEVCGENVELSEDKKVATWVSKNSDGWACSEAELKPGEVFEVKVEGSGRCDIGFMKEEQTSVSFKTLNEIRAHRRTCRIEVTLKENGDECFQISSKFGEKTFKKKIEKETKVWIAIYIRYGEMSVELMTKGDPQSNKKFSSAKHGTNITLENDNIQATSVSKNPASICFISEQLEVGGTLHLNCEPEKEGDRQPSRYELRLHVSEKDPSTLKNEFKYLFEASYIKTSDPPLTTIESFEKDECNGEITVTLSDSKTVQYKTARGKQNTQVLNFNAKNGVWVVLGLYRVKAQAVSYEAISGAVGGPVSTTTGVDEPDSLPLRPRVTAVPPEDNVERHDRQTAGGSEQVVKHLAGRVMSLEQELQNMKLQTQSSPSSAPQPVPVPGVPQVVSSPDMNVLADELGDQLDLKKRFPELVKEIDTKTFCDHLYAKDIITLTQMESIHAVFRNNGSADANRDLLKIMKTKRIEKDIMIQIVEESQQSHLLKMFYPPKNSTEKK
ncbi:uncharacterized protein LOC128550309 isoform X1 [Mercenaria mercenaria]|uniref:uncharacterized protein LOC128550309 isoform X1 n=1 Tax=Mercenaria mercenaria TaxID=6596 RepID=UPI00234EC91A|nr:uncharacterized protein LOC128550309 isoform X1 [Mercenaria mercenaria]